MQEKPALFQALRNRREGFLVIPPVIFTPPRGPEPTPSSNKPSGSESNISIRGGGGRGGEKKGFNVLISTQRSAEGKYSLGNHVMLLFRFGESLCSEQEACLCVLWVQPARQPVSQSDS